MNPPPYSPPLLLHPVLHVHLLLLVTREGREQFQTSPGYQGTPFMLEEEVCLLGATAKEKHIPCRPEDILVRYCTTDITMQARGHLGKVLYH